MLCVCVHSQNRCLMVSTFILQNSHRLEFFNLYFKRSLFVVTIRIKYVYWKFLSLESIEDKKVLLYISFQLISILSISFDHFSSAFIGSLFKLFSWNIYNILFTWSDFNIFSRRLIVCLAFIFSDFRSIYHSFGIHEIIWLCFKLINQINVIKG